MSILLRVAADSRIKYGHLERTGLAFVRAFANCVSSFDSVVSGTGSGSYLLAFYQTCTLCRTPTNYFGSYLIATVLSADLRVSALLYRARNPGITSRFVCFRGCYEFFNFTIYVCTICTDDTIFKFID